MSEYFGFLQLVVHGCIFVEIEEINYCSLSNTISVSLCSYLGWNITCCFSCFTFFLNFILEILDGKEINDTSRKFLLNWKANKEANSKRRLSSKSGENKRICEISESVIFFLQACYAFLSQIFTFLLRRLNI